MVDAGDAAWKSSAVGDSRLAQSQLKGEIQADAWNLVGIDAVTPGEGDLALGLDWYKSLVASRHLPVVATNLSCGDPEPFPKTLEVRKGDVRLAFLGIMGTDLLLPEGCKATDPVAAVKAALPGLGAHDLVVVLSQQSKDEDARLAEQVAALELFVNGHNRLTLGAAKPLSGRAAQLAAGSRGKKVGVASITLVPGGHGFQVEAATKDLEARHERFVRRLEDANKTLKEADKDSPEYQRAERQVGFYSKEVTRIEGEIAAAGEAGEGAGHILSNKLYSLVESVEEHDATQALVDAAKEKMDKEPTEVDQPKVDGPYVGQTFCRTCHVEQTNQWKKTDHANAWLTLVREKRNNDHDCFSCHATGANQPGGPSTPAEVGKLKNVQCEVCHGPGREHVESKGEVDMVKAPGPEVCTACHDGERDQGRNFEFETYLPKVAH